jgi:RNA polymerase sigma-70 factor (ECF subfamily)
VATLTKMFGDLGAAEDAVQDACVLAVTSWPVTGVPANPGAWLTGTARHKALDRLRREGRRPAKEAEATRLAEAIGVGEAGGVGAEGGQKDELGLIFLCCHPALDRQARVALTLRCVCGLPTAEIAAAFLVPKRKIRQAGIAFGVPRGEELTRRLGPVLRVVYLVFTQGHRAGRGPELIRGELCDQAIRLARALAVLLPGEPEAAGLLALLLLTDARRAARLDLGGELVPLADQDRGRWDRDLIVEGDALLTRALTARRPGPYQLHAAIAACHSVPAETDWPQIALLYGELARYEPTAVTEANRAVAVAMAGQPAAALGILDAQGTRLARWPQFHIARAELLRQLERPGEARAAYRAALGLALAHPERAHLERRLAELLPPPSAAWPGRYPAERYSVAMAARMSRRAARRAGQVAAIRPSTADSSRKITRLDTGTTVSVMPLGRSETTRARPSAVPITIPTMAPKTARMTASDLIIVRTWRRRMPTARSRPISRVRSKTDSMSVFTIPMSAMSTARPSRAYTRPSSWLTLATWVCSNWARVWTCRFG